MALAYAALAHHDEVVPAADEVAGGQLLDLHAIDGGGIELPVEGFQVPGFSKASLADAVLDAAFAPLVGLLADQGFEEFQMREVFALGLSRGRVELLGGQGNLQHLEVFEKTITKFPWIRLTPRAAGHLRKAPARREIGIPRWVGAVPADRSAGDAGGDALRRPGYPEPSCAGPGRPGFAP